MPFASDAQRRWFFANHGSSGGSGGGSGSGGGMPSFTQPGSGYEAYMADPARRDERLAYAQAMFPHLSESDALRELNDRNG